MNMSNITVESMAYINQQCKQTIINTTCKVSLPLLVFGFIGLYIISAVIHEFGHWVILHIYQPNAKISFFKNEKGRYLFVTGSSADYYLLSNESKLKVYFAGIIAGLVPITIAGGFHQVFFLMYAPYVVNCYSDFKKIWRLIKWMK